MNKLFFCLLSLVVLTAGQRITTIHLDGVQYFISRMNPYSPELNYFLAYQYCRSLGLQLASFETKEKAQSMTTYLKNAGYGNYDFWTSGNRLGTGMFLWMSTGLPFNATFDFFENTADAIQAGLLDPVDHNSNTSPQRTARDSSSGAEKGCVILKQPTLKWMPEDCSAVKDFICEQTRCYYYNYGSIPVSSAQGRPITTTTARPLVDMLKTETTTPLPLLMSAFTTTARKINNQPSYVSLKLDQDQPLLDSDSQMNNDDELDDSEHEAYDIDNGSAQKQTEEVQGRDLPHEEEHVDISIEKELDAENPSAEVEQHDEDDEVMEADAENKSAEQKLILSAAAAAAQSSSSSASMEEEAEDSVPAVAAAIKDTSADVSYETENNASEMPAVEVRLKQISQEVEKRTNEEQQQNRHIPALSPELDDIGHQSFLSLTDLIRTLRPNDKQIVPQIDSDYSNAMRVLVNSNSNNSGGKME